MNNRGGYREGAGRPNNWGEPTTRRRVPVSKADDLMLYLETIPEAIDNKIEELRPRQSSERVKLAWEILQELQAIYKEK